MLFYFSILLKQTVISYLQRIWGKTTLLITTVTNYDVNFLLPSHVQVLQAGAVQLQRREQ